MCLTVKNVLSQMVYGAPSFAGLIFYTDPYCHFSYFLKNPKPCQWTNANGPLMALHTGIRVTNK